MSPARRRSNRRPVRREEHHYPRSLRGEEINVHKIIDYSKPCQAVRIQELPLENESLAVPIERGRHRSLRAAVSDAIRADLLSGLLPPGQRISVTALQRRFGTGLSAVREALCQLVAEGMVVAEDQRGFRATPISAHDLADLTEVRVKIECLAIRDAIAHGDTEWEAVLLAEFHRLSARRSRDAMDSRRIDAAYQDQHKRFHDALIAGCTSDWIKRFHTTLHHHSERYRELIVSYYAESHVRDILGEHREMMEAALARDADRAASLVERHIRQTAEILLRIGVAQA